MPGILYAIPTPLGGAAASALSAPTLQTVRSLRRFVVENAKSARAFLNEIEMPCPLQELDITTIGIEFTLAIGKLREGESVGLLSEAGCPAIADPGAKLVEAAHAAGIRVVPLVGPSSIVLALMASGLEGQRFAFCGYLPREAEERKRKIRELEARSRREGETQIFIETPYRNDTLVDALLANCAPEARLCLATDLTSASESVATRSIAEWRRQRPAVGKRPTVFLLLSG